LLLCFYGFRKPLIELWSIIMETAIPSATSRSDISIDASNPAHYVDWSAIAAGAFIAVAISSVFLAFGSAIGLSLTSFKAVNSLSITGLVIAASLWLLWVQVSSFIGGGYVAGRLRRRIGDATPHEVEMRDGSHGLIVWAVGVVLGTVLTSWLTISGVAGAANGGTMDYYAEKLLRNETIAPSTGSVPVSVTVNNDELRQIGQILAQNIGAKVMDDADKSYLVRIISTQTGLPEAGAQDRLDQTVKLLKAQADTARRYGILIAFLTAASLLVSAVAAWWVACSGGRHRDEGVDHSHLTRWR
jgi:hypothetical protein